VVRVEAELQVRAERAHLGRHRHDLGAVEVEFAVDGIEPAAALVLRQGEVAHEGVLAVTVPHTLRVTDQVAAAPSASP
jgi:hypothetical protein